MRIALYGPYMFELAVGLRENPSNDVRLFLDEETLPRSLLAEPQIHDSGFVRIGPWANRRAILRPRGAPITRVLAEFDVALVTELGPIFAQHADTEYFFIPTGWDLTCGPFPIRSRSSRRRGFGDLSAAVIAIRMRSGIRAAIGIWGAPFAPFRTAAERLGRQLTDNLPQPIDMALFDPGRELVGGRATEGDISIFHPSRMMMTEDRFHVETGQWKRNDLLFEGVALAVADGIDARIRLLQRASSPDQARAREMIEDLKLTAQVEWVDAGTPDGFTWSELADLYRSSDLVVDEFGGWFGLVALEGAACGRPVLNRVDPLVMEELYPDGYPFLQASDAEQVAEVIVDLVDPGRRREVGEASREWVLRHHDRSVVARRTESALAGLGFS
jgi:glycosyltransferase involved in cell wall biosynthesis